MMFYQLIGAKYQLITIAFESIYIWLYTIMLSLGRSKEAVSELVLFCHSERSEESLLDSVD